MSETAEPYDREAIFRTDGPFHPSFMREAIRTLLRSLPIDEDEPRRWADRRMLAALRALAALHPRDEIEVLLGVQTLCAYHAAGECWRLGMNLPTPGGRNLRHFTAAATASRTFDSLLKALERRQAKKLSIPEGRPPCQTWPDPDPTPIMQAFNDLVANDGEPPKPPRKPATWTPEAVAYTKELMEKNRIERDNDGLDIANTEGILPGGGMVVPRNATPNQTAYLSRRMAIDLRRQRHEAMKKGITIRLKIPNIAVGDFFP